MNGGFSFCGTDIQTLGLYYAPPLSETYVYKTGNYNINDETFEAHDGGYFYGTTMKPKDFALRCFFQDSYINDGILTKINSFFKRGKTGRLVFQKRQWCWYTATVVSVDFSQITNHSNGIITINLRAYYPFARTDLITLRSASDDIAENVAANSGLVEYLPATDNSQVTNPAYIGTFVIGKDIFGLRRGVSGSGTTPFILFNGGTQRASLAIQISGNISGEVTITNKTTGQSCKFIALDKLQPDQYVVCDSLNGKTYVTDGTTTKLGFIHHVGGFIDLEPAYPIDRNIDISYERQSSTITSNGVFTDDHVGKYIYVDGSWHRIMNVSSPDAATIDTAMMHDGTQTTNIVLMNQIQVTGTNYQLKRLNFVYRHTFS